MKKGFTLIEVLIVIGITVLFAGAAFVNMKSALGKAPLDSGTASVSRAFETARNRAMQGVSGADWSVHLSKNEVVVFEGDDWLAYSGGGEETLLPPSVTTSETDATIVFEHLSGTPSAAIAVTVTHATAGSSDIEVNEIGAVFVE